MRNAVICRLLMRALPSAVLAAAVTLPQMASAATRTGGSGTEERPHRELHVPMDDLHIILEGNARHVMLTRSEYRALRDAARHELEQPPPLDACFTAAEYHIDVNDERAVLTGQFTVSVLADGETLLPLDLDPWDLLSATLDGEPAPMISSHPDGSGTAALICHRPGTRELVIEAVTQLRTTKARQLLAMNLPTSPATRIYLSMPGDVEVKQGAAVISRAYDDKTKTTRFELLSAAGQSDLEMSLNSRLKRRDRVVASSGLLVARISEAYEQVHATISLDVLHRAVDAFSFDLPAGYEVTRVATPDLASWEIDRTATPPVLQVRLHEETSERTVVDIEAVRTHPNLGEWSLPRLAPRDVISHTSVIGILLESRLALDSLSPVNLIPVRHASVAAALAQEDSPAGRAATQARAVAAYYAATPDFSLKATFSKPATELIVTGNILLALSDSGVAANGGFVITPQHEEVFGIDLRLPSAWALQSIGRSAGEALIFETEKRDDYQLVHVRLPDGFAAGGNHQLIFKAQHVPAGWFDPWQKTSLELPLFRVMGASQDSGAIAIETQDDLVARPEELSALTPMDANEKRLYGLDGSNASLVYRYEQHPYAATFAIAREKPRLTAESYSFFAVDRDTIHARLEMIFTVEQARTRAISLRLPAAFPTALAITGLNGTVVKAYASELQEGGDRLWRVMLGEPAIATVHLAIDADLPVVADEQRATAFSVPIPVAVGVVYQSGFVAIEGHPELDVVVKDAPRAVDAGEMADADYLPGRRLIGAYGYVGPPPAMQLVIGERTAYSLPTALVDTASLSTRISTDGKAQTVAEFTIRTKMPYLAIGLPKDAELWSLLIDGRPVRAQYEGRLLVDLPTTGAPVQLGIVYESPSEPLFFHSRIAVAPPTLEVLDAARTAGIAIPIADFAWTLGMPSEYRVAASYGSVQPMQLPEQESAATMIARNLYRLTGGVSFGRGAIGGCLMAPLAMSRNRASSMRMGGIVSADMTEYDSEERSQIVLDDAPALRAAPASGPMRQAGPTPAAQPKAKPAWSREGSKGLRISLDQSDARIMCRSLGGDPQLKLELLQTRRLAALGLAAALIVLVGGLVLISASGKRRALYIATVLFLATLLPGLPRLGVFTGVFNAAFYAACALVPGFVVANVLRKIARFFTSRIIGGTVAGVIAISLFTVRTLDAAPAVGSIDHPPVMIPEDAIIVPYNADGSESENLLVPYSEYTALRKTIEDAAARLTTDSNLTYRGSITHAAYKVALSGADDLLMVDGELQAELFVEGPVMLLLPVENMMLESVDVDGEPARLGAGTARVPPNANPGQRQAQPSQSDADQQIMQSQQGHVVGPAAALQLVLEGRGRHTITLRGRTRLRQQGGWLKALAHLPSAPSTTLTITVPDAGTDVEIPGIGDRNRIRTTEDNETIRTALGTPLQLNWRPRVAEADIDRSLTAQSQSLVDIRKDVIRIIWNGTLSFRKGERSSFEVLLPDHYIVEAVGGDNVRGWSLPEEADTARRLRVELLKAATESERFTITLAQPGGVSGESPLVVPQLSVPGAIRETGTLTIRCGRALELRTLRAENATRTDLQTAAALAIPADVVADSPLGTRPYQSYEFVTVPYTIAVETTAREASVAAECQTLLRVTPREQTLEARMALEVSDGPVFAVRVALPVGLELDRVTTSGRYEWSVTDAADAQDGTHGAQRILTVYSTTGLTSDTPLFLQGRLKTIRDGAMLLPRLVVLGTEHQGGVIAVQTDPAYDIHADALSGIKLVLLSNLAGWLKAEQRSFTRTALSYTSTEFSGRLQLVRREPQVTATSVTNVRVTDRSIEETTLLDFTIKNAGIRRIDFTLPIAMKDARITVPLLRERHLTPTEDGRNVSVRLDLQDMVMNQLRVLIQGDRLLTKGPHTIDLPSIQTGGTLRRYLAIESAGRDEVVLEGHTALGELSRQQKEWKLVEPLLRGGATRAFLADDSAENPSLTFTTTERKAVQTAGARIGLARTVLMMDGAGTYRGVQTYSVDNQTEQFLEIDLPEGAALWTAVVAGEFVKPIATAGAAESLVPRRVRIPLVKTAAGDLDYTVHLRYGGNVAHLAGLSRIDFPFIKTININVEASQVELRLPTSYRWMRFDGTMRQLGELHDLEAGRLAYKQKLANRLIKTVQFGNPFEKARAMSNLKSIKSSIQQSQGTYADSYNANLQKEISKASTVLEDADEKLADATLDVDGDGFSNRGELNDWFAGQKNKLAENVVIPNDGNWSSEQRQIDQSVPHGERAVPDEGGEFNSGWLVANGLVVTDATTVSEDLSGELRDKQMAAHEPATVNPNAQLYVDNLESQSRIRGLNTVLQKKGGKGKDAADFKAAEEKELTTGRSQGKRAQKYQEKLEQQQVGQSVDYEQIADPFAAPQAQSTVDRAMGSGGGGDVMPTESEPAPVNRDFDAGDAASAGLASLDVQLPAYDASRWSRYLFSKPRGSVTVNAMALSNKLEAALTRAGLALLVLVVLVLLFALTRAIANHWSPDRRRVARVMAFTGLIGLLLGVLPLLGILALVASPFVAITARRKGRILPMGEGRRPRRLVTKRPS